MVVAVFGWGLQYKLSLYNSSDVYTTSFPHAKLLSPKERPASAPDIASTTSPTPQLELLSFYTGCLLAAIVFSFPMPTSGRNLKAPAKEQSRKQRYAASNFFSFRPPPALLPIR